jgi:nitroreductase
MHKLTLSCLILLFSGAAVAQELKPVALPPPRMTGGLPLQQALQARQSQREFAPDALPPQVLSDLLWAAWGISRPDSGKRTAPSAMNRQEMDVYAVLADGAYLYEPKAHQLLPVAAGDLRAATGTQGYVAGAPLNLVYVSRAAGGPAEDQLIYGGSQAGFISENVYLFCASEGLATVVRGSVQRGDLARALGLAPDRKIILAQTVGYPAKK